MIFFVNFVSTLRNISAYFTKISYNDSFSTLFPIYHSYLPYHLDFVTNIIQTASVNKPRNKYKPYETQADTDRLTLIPVFIHTSCILSVPVYLSTFCHMQGLLGVLLSCPWARKMSRDVPAGAGFLRHKSAFFSVTIHGTFSVT